MGNVVKAHAIAEVAIFAICSIAFGALAILFGRKKTSEGRFESMIISMLAMFSSLTLTLFYGYWIQPDPYTFVFAATTTPKLWQFWGIALFLAAFVAIEIAVFLRMQHMTGFAFTVVVVGIPFALLLGSLTNSGVTYYAFGFAVALWLLSLFMAAYSTNRFEDRYLYWLLPYMFVCPGLYGLFYVLGQEALGLVSYEVEIWLGQLLPNILVFAVWQFFAVRLVGSATWREWVAMGRAQWHRMQGKEKAAHAARVGDQGPLNDPGFASKFHDPAIRKRE